MLASPSLTSFRRLFALAVMALALAFPLSGANAALNGTLYAVVAPVFDGSTGTVSYIRLFNGASTNTTFSITVVDASTGATLGTPVMISVAKNASPQFPLTGNGFSPPGITPIFNLAGVTDSPTTNYALYIQNASPLAGYQHVTFNSTSSLFENMSACKTLLDEQINAASNSMVLTNVHTSSLGGGTAFPSVINIHNYYNTTLTYQISVIDAQNGGLPIVQFTQAVGANETVSIPESQIEAKDGFHPTSTQYQINLIVTDVAGNPPYEELTHNIANAQLGGGIDMTMACAVNQLTTSSGGGGVVIPPGGLNGY